LGPGILLFRLLGAGGKRKGKIKHKRLASNPNQLNRLTMPGAAISPPVRKKKKTRA